MRKFPFAVAIFMALATRAIFLDKGLPYLSNDEISIAYDAYSIAKTGRDERNISWPLSFLSHGTYKAPAYSYLLAPLTRILGNTDFTAKLPSIILGTITVLIIGLIAFELTGNQLIGALSSLSLAITPWHIFTSRMVLESSLALGFLSLGILFFLKSTNNTRYLFPTSLFMVLSMYSYHTEWVISPLLILLMSRYYFKKSIKLALTFLTISLILITPLFTDYILKSRSPDVGNMQANSQTIWRDGPVIDKIKQQSFPINKITPVIKTFAYNYLRYTNPGYLFFHGMNLFDKLNPYDTGLFLAPAIIPFFLGLYYSKKYISRPLFSFFIIWLVLSPIVPALTRGDNNFIRNLVSILPYTICIGIGSTYLFTRYKKTAITLLTLTIISFFYFEAAYLVHSPIDKAEGFESYKPVFEFLRSYDSKYSLVKIDDRFGTRAQFIGVPHLYLAYYNYLNPTLLQNRRYTKEGVYYGKYLVAGINWDNIIKCDYLYVVPIGNAPPPEKTKYLELVKEFTDAANTPAFQIWKANSNSCPST